ncbi:MAG: fructosamine kinase family protein [Ornithinimicrobium sp.]
MRPETLPADLIAGFDVSEVRSVAGGSISEVFVGQTPRGRVFFKSRVDPPSDFYEREMVGLRALRATATVPVPEVLRHHRSGLALEWIEHEAESAPVPDDAGAEEFGRGLAGLHRHTGPHFGSIDDYPHGYLGSVRLDLSPQEQWSTAYVQHRVHPLARQAVERGRVDPAALSLVDRLIARGPEVCGPAEQPCLVHGDLWAGNRVVDAQARHWIIDPSVHYGHREIDLALMRLFGGFAEATFAAYQEVYPLADGWQQRIALHQLAPLLANTLMHGSVFGASVMTHLRRSLQVA